MYIYEYMITCWVFTYLTQYYICMQYNLKNNNSQHEHKIPKKQKICTRTSHNNEQ